MREWWNVELTSCRRRRFIIGSKSFVAKLLGVSLSSRIAVSLREMRSRQSYTLSFMLAPRRSHSRLARWLIKARITYKQIHKYIYYVLQLLLQPLLMNRALESLRQHKIF